MMFYLQNIVYFLFLMVLSTVMTYFCRRYVRIMDYPKSRGLHERAVPRSGGIAIVFTFLTGILIYYGLHSEYFIAQKVFSGLLLSALFITASGIYDDITGKGLVYKLVSQFIAVGILLAYGVTINEWTIPFMGTVSFGDFRYILTILWIIGITNAFNFMDGLDGLAGTIAVIASLSLAFISIHRGSGVTFHISYILAASCIGFLVYNYPKASIFMGDLGSTFLGFSFALMAILTSNHYDAHHTPFMVVPILLANIILETLFTFIWRLYHRQQVYRAHKLHPYQLLRQMGVSSKRIVLIYGIQSVLLAIAAFIYAFSHIGMQLTMLAVVLACYSIFFFSVHHLARSRGMVLLPALKGDCGVDCHAVKCSGRERGMPI